MQNHYPRFPWAALIVGLVLGLVGGLAYAWFLNPVNFVNISPSMLSEDDQRDYILLVAEAYLQDGDLDRARMRLAALGSRDVAERVTVLADNAFLRGDDPERVRALAALSEALGQRSMAADVFSGTTAPTTPPELLTPTATFEGMPSPTPSQSPATAFPTTSLEIPSPTPDLFPKTDLSLIDRGIICEDDYPSGRIEVYVYDGSGQSVPGIEVLVEWEGGQDRFFTGLKPDIDPGYADFELEGDRVYTVTLVGRAEPVLGIDSAGCLTPAGRTAIPTYRLTFAPAAGFEEGEP